VSALPLQRWRRGPAESGFEVLARSIRTASLAKSRSAACRLSRDIASSSNLLRILSCRSRWLLNDIDLIKMYPNCDCADAPILTTIGAKQMRKRVDPAIELAAEDPDSHDWLSVNLWQVLIAGILRVKQLCCFREWSDPYPDSVGDRLEFTCGECRHRGPIEHVPDDVFGREGILPAFDLSSCPSDPACRGERLKPVSCAAVFAREVSRYCARLDEVLQPDHSGAISRERAQEAHWAFAFFRKHVPDWDPSGGYDGAFERWEEECARERLPPWGPPELVPLVERLSQEREEALTGAQRAYDKIIAPAERALGQALTEAARLRDEAEIRFMRNQGEEIRRFLAGPHRINRKLVAEIWAAQRAAQMKSNEEARRDSPLPLASRERCVPLAGDPRSRPPTEPPPPSEAAAAYTHLRAMIQAAYKKAEASALRVHARVAARAERAYQKAMAAPRPTSRQYTPEERDWDLLLQLAERLTELSRRVDKAIGRFRVVDVTRSDDEIIRHKRTVKAELDLPRVQPPAPVPIGPRNLAKFAEVKRLGARGMSAKQIHAQTKVPVKTVYRWLKLP
jgi:hypothetical protein